MFIHALNYFAWQSRALKVVYVERWEIQFEFFGASTSIYYIYVFTCTSKYITRWFELRSLRLWSQVRLLGPRCVAFLGEMLKEYTLSLWQSYGVVEDKVFLSFAPVWYTDNAWSLLKRLIDDRHLKVLFLLNFFTTHDRIRGQPTNRSGRALADLPWTSFRLIN